MRAFVAVLSVAVASSSAGAELLPGTPRAVSSGDSASRDAPVIEYAYGPRAQLSLGSELGLYLRHGVKTDFRLSVFGLVALENVGAAQPVPDEAFRLLFGVTAAWARPAPWHVGVLEISLGLAREQSATLGGYVVETPPSNGIPFGGGGIFLDPMVAWRASLGRFEVTARADVRVHLPALVLLFGQRVAADVAADATSDALTNQPALEFTLRWRLTERWQPIITGHADLQFPEDTSARTGFFVRALCGVAIRGSAGELTPFVSGDVGNGLGVLVNRHERRLSVGVRYAVF